MDEKALKYLEKWKFKHLQVQNKWVSSVCRGRSCTSTTCGGNVLSKNLCDSLQDQTEETHNVLGGHFFECGHIRRGLFASEGLVGLVVQMSRFEA